MHFYLNFTCPLIVCVCVLRSKEVDWQPYFTTRLVDDFATHLRVFRKAQDRLADREDKQSMQTYSGYLSPELMQFVLNSDFSYVVLK